MRHSLMWNSPNCSSIGRKSLTVRSCLKKHVLHISSYTLPYFFCHPFLWMWTNLIHRSYNNFLLFILSFSLVLPSPCFLPVAFIFIPPSSWSLFSPWWVNLSLSCWRNKQNAKVKTGGQRATVSSSHRFWWEEQTVGWQHYSEVFWEKGTVRTKTLRRQSRLREATWDAPGQIQPCSSENKINEGLEGWARKPVIEVMHLRKSSSQTFNSKYKLSSLFESRNINVMLQQLLFMCCPSLNCQSPCFIDCSPLKLSRQFIWHFSFFSQQAEFKPMVLNLLYLKAQFGWVKYHQEPHYWINKSKK